MSDGPGAMSQESKCMGDRVQACTVMQFVCVGSHAAKMRHADSANGNLLVSEPRSVSVYMDSRCQVHQRVVHTGIGSGGEDIGKVGAEGWWLTSSFMCFRIKGGIQRQQISCCLLRPSSRSQSLYKGRARLPPQRELHRSRGAANLIRDCCLMS